MFMICRHPVVATPKPRVVLLLVLNLNDPTHTLVDAPSRYIKEFPAVSGCDFGEVEYGDFRDGLDAFTAALRNEAGLTLIGRVVATHRIAMLLDQRLRLVAYWSAAN